MRKFMWVLIGLFFGILMSIVGKFLNTAIQKGKLFPAYRSTAQLLFPKSDLFSPVAIVPINTLKTGDTATANFRHKYAGDYGISLIVGLPKSFPPRDPSIYDYQIQMICMDSKGNKLEEINLEYKDKIRPFLGLGLGGVEVAEYSVPEVMPIYEMVTCEFTVLKPAYEFTKLFGGQAIMFRKDSEK